MKSNVVQSDLVVVEYQSFYGRNMMKTLSLDLLYSVVGHVQETQFFHGAVDAEQVRRHYWQRVASENQHLRKKTQKSVRPKARTNWQWCTHEGEGE